MSTSVRVPGIVGVAALAAGVASVATNVTVQIPVQRIELAWTLVRLLIEL